MPRDWSHALRPTGSCCCSGQACCVQFREVLLEFGVFRLVELLELDALADGSCVDGSVIELVVREVLGTNDRELVRLPIMLIVFNPTRLRNIHGSTAENSKKLFDVLMLIAFCYSRAKLINQRGCSLLKRFLATTLDLWNQLEGQSATFVLLKNATWRLKTVTTRWGSAG